MKKLSRFCHRKQLWLMYRNAKSIICYSNTIYDKLNVYVVPYGVLYNYFHFRMNVHLSLYLNKFSCRPDDINDFDDHMLNI